MTDTELLVRAIVRSLDEHKARDIRVLDVAGITPITDCFIVASGTSTTQVRALADHAEEDLRRAGLPSPLREEGYGTGQWVLLDYGVAVVHLFLETTREFYDLERLWQDATVRDTAGFLEDN